jgi:hypothetical protein
MNKEVNRFFREAQALSKLPAENWISPGNIPAPSLEIQGENQEANKKKLVDIANSMLVETGRRAGDYSGIYYSFKTVKTRIKDPRTGRMVSRAVVSLAVLEREKEKSQ